jgi:hypothetical protein
VGTVFDAMVTAVPATRMLVPQFLATGPDPEFGWPAIAQMLSELQAGNTSKLDELSGASTAFLTMASEDPWLRAGQPTSQAVDGERGYIDEILDASPITSQMEILVAIACSPSASR